MEVILSRSMVYTSLFMLISMAGCGSNNQAPGDGGVAPPSGYGIGGPETNYQWDDESCISGSTLGTKLTTATISSWAESTRRDVSIPLGDLINDRGGIDSKNIASKVTTRSLFSRDCARMNGSQCLDNTGKEPGFAFVSDGPEPKFCRPDGKYGIDSIERVTLTSALFLRTAVKFATDTYKDQGQLTPIQLLVLPRFASTIPSSGLSQSDVLVDNLAYFPMKNNATPYIAVLPRRLNSSEANPRLWEAEFVLAHEFGHHIERYLHVDRFFDRVSVVRSAASEAFADLNAYATAGLSDNTIRYIPCGSNRAVGIGTFSDDTAKVFDSAEINAIETNAPSAAVSFGFLKEKNTCGSKINSHGIGAILAYNVGTMIEQGMDAVKTSSGTRAKTFALSSASWIKDLDQRITKGTNSPRKDIIAAGRALESTVKEIFSKAGVPLSPNVAKALCERMALGFSGTNEKTWFGSDCGQQTQLMAQD